MFDFIRLLDLNADTDRIYTWFYQHAFVLVPRYSERVQKNLGGFGSFDFRNVMTLCSLTGEVAKGDCGGQGGANAFEVWPERLRLDIVNYWQGDECKRDLPFVVYSRLVDKG